MSDADTVSFTQAVITGLKYAITDALAIPMRIENHLKQHPELRIDMPPLGHVMSTDHSLVHWDLWSGTYRQDLHYWQREYNGYRCTHIALAELANLVTSEKIESWSCDITDVDCVMCSKSKLSEFATLDDMVEANSRDYIDAITDEKLKKNLAHQEIRIIHSKGSDHFVRYAWDGRLYLANSGGSHHFAAARYIAKRLPREVPLHGTLYIYRLNSTSVNSLNARFRMFAINGDNFFRGFSEVLETFDCPYGLLDAPRPFNLSTGLLKGPRTFNDAKVLFLDKSNQRAMRVADVLENAGVINWNLFLTRQAVGGGARAT